MRAALLALRLRPLLVVAVMIAGCGRGEADSPPRKAQRGVDVDRIPVPNHGPEVMAGDHEMRRTRSTEGTIEAMIDGDHVQHGFLPYGMNAAIASEKTGVSRLTLSGSPTDAGYPALHLRFEGLRIDQVELPMRFPPEGASSKKRKNAGESKPALPKIEYHLTEHVVFESDPGREDETFAVTLDSFEGDTVTGTFEATLHPREERFGQPKRVERGRFEVMVRRSGVEPGRSPGADDPSMPGR